jgi:Mg-chelatase subunit ChlD
VTFLSPWALALLAAALPILWLLHRRRPVVLVPVSSLHLWREAFEPPGPGPTRRRRALDWLLVLDTAILLALGFALARPARLPGGRSVAVVLDVSLSMSALEAGGTRLELAREEADAFLDSLDPGDAVMVVAGSSSPRVVQDLTRDREAAREALRSLEPSAGSARLGDAIQLALSKLESGSEIAVFSDGAKGAEVPEGLDPPRVRYFHVGETSDNVAVARLAARRSLSSPFDQEVYVEVRSFSEKEHVVPLRLADADGVFLNARLRVPPRGSRSASVRRAFRSESVIEAAIEAGDALPLDDRAYAVSGPEAAIPVLLVTAGNAFLEAALSSHPAIRLAVVSPERYRSGFVSADVVVLDPTLEAPRAEPRVLAIHRPAAASGAPLEPIEVRDASHPLLAGVDFTGLAIGATSSVAASPGDRVLAAAGGRPVLVAAVSEEGRRVLVSGELLSGAFPLSPSFPILVANAIEWLRANEDDDGGTALVAGERADVPDRPGVYSVRRGDRTHRLAVAAPVAAESDIARIERAPAPEPGAFGIEGASRPREMYVYLLLAAVLLLLAERRFDRLGLAWAALAVLLAALIAPAAPVGRRLEPIVVALDSSESVSEGSRLRTLERISTVLEAEQPRGEKGTVVFGRDAWIEQALGPEALSIRPSSDVDRNQSNLEAGLRLAGTMLGGEDGGRIVLASDGNETIGDSVRAAAALRSRGLVVDVIPVEASAGGASALAAVDVRAPSRVRLGEPFEVAVTIAGRPGARGIVELHRGDGTLSKREIALERERGVARFIETATSPGAHSYRAHPGAGAGALVWASGRSRILHVSPEGRSGVLAEALERRGFDVVSMPPSRVPETPAGLADFDAILFADVPARGFRASQLASIAGYVERAGGGFVMAGGASSFGPGGYAGTSLDAILPVDVRGGGGPARESVGVVLVIDKSGSMGVDEAGASKIRAAGAAAIAIERLLGPEDVLGAIAFDREPQTLLPLRRVGSGDLLSSSPIQSLGARGATKAGDAIAEACSWLEDVDVSRRLLLFVSDGQLEEEDFRRTVELLRGSGVTLSAIGIGADADRERLEALARAGGGEAVFVPVSDASAELLASEAARLSRGWDVERETSIRPGQRHPIARGIDLGSLPRLPGYVPTSKRENAATILETERDEPILAAWQAGVGRTLALTSSNLASWDSFEQLWLQAVRWTARRSEEGALHPRAEISDRRVRVAVDAQGEDGWFRNGLEARARVRFPEGAKLLDISLEQTAPGRYEGGFDLDGPGPYLLRASAQAPGGDWEDSVPFGVWASGASELRSVGPHLPLLHEIARNGGGRVLERAEALAGRRKTRSAGLGIWPALTALAALVFLAHVARRTGAWPRSA